MEYSQTCKDWTTHIWITNEYKSNKKGNKRNTLEEMKIEIHVQKKKILKVCGKRGLRAKFIVISAYVKNKRKFSNKQHNFITQGTRKWIKSLN